MNRRALLTGALLLLACSSAPPPAARPRPARPGTSTQPLPHVRAPRFCPAGTEQVGAKPPEGEVIWCEDEDGRKQGPYRAWYESGALEEEGQYKDGTRVGAWRFFGPDGDLRGTRTFQLRVTVKLCVYEKATKRGLDGALVLVTNIETGDTSTAQTDPFGRANVVIDSGRGRVEVVGPFPRPEAHADLASSARPLAIALDSKSVQRMVQRGMGRLSSVASCAK
jgi:hypothetical protein